MAKMFIKRILKNHLRVKRVMAHPTAAEPRSIVIKIIEHQLRCLGQSEAASGVVDFE